MKKKRAPRKGFPVQLNKSHWFSVALAYDYAVANGLTTPEMTEAAALIPDDVRPPNEAVTDVVKAQTDYRFWWVNGSKTVRFRASQVTGARELLRLAVYLSPHGQIGSTIQTRLTKLEKVGDLDLLADAGR